LPRTVPASLAWRLLTAVLLMAALALLLLDPLAINHDAAACLQVGDLLLAGRALYVDISASNPPLIYYLNVIPAALARSLGWPLAPTFLFGVWLLTVLSVIATGRLVAKAFGAGSVHAGLVPAALAACSLWLLQRGDYGQREHLFVLALLPYYALRFCREEGRGAGRAAAITCGVVGAIGACLKPHFLAAALAPEVYWMATRRSWRPTFPPELVAFAATGLAYGAFFALMPAAVHAFLFERSLPLTWHGYAAYNAPILTMIADVGVWLPPCACLLVFAAGDRNRMVLRFARPLAIAGFVLILGYFAQHKGWSYHPIPAYAIVFVMVALAAGELLDPAGVTPTSAHATRALSLRVVCGILVAMLAVETVTAVKLVAGGRFTSALARLEAVDPLASAIASHTAPRESVLVMSTSVDTAYPLLVQLDRRPASRYLDSETLSMLYFGTAAEPGQSFPYALTNPRWRAEEARFREELAADIQASRPGVIAVATGACQGCPQGFTLDDYLSRTGFRQGPMAEYRELTQLPGATVYVR
jgi:hypothetical protein